MVISPCEKCGEKLKHNEDDIPPSGMVVKCPVCQTSVTVMPAGAAAMGMHAADEIFSLDDDDLVEDNGLAPVSGGSGLPAPVAKKRGLPDLPAPVAKKRGLPDLPAPVAKKAGVPNLPAPVAKKAGVPNLPAPVAKKAGVPNLPAPVPMGGQSNLPAPVGFGGASDLPAPVPAGGQSNLPAPVGFGGTNLPAPVGPGGQSNLPAPVGFGGTNLPAPVGASGPSDLPAPVGFGGTNLPAPVGGSGADLPAPVGGGPNSDLLAPVSTGIGLDGVVAPVGKASPGSPAAVLDLGGLEAGQPDSKSTMMGLGAAATVDPLGGGLDLGGGGGGDPLGGGLDLGSPGGGDPLGGGLDLGGGGAPLGGGLDLGSPTGAAPLGGGLDLGSPTGGDPLGGGGLDLGGPNDALGGGLDLGSPAGGDPLGGGGLDLGGPNDALGGGLDIGGPNDALGGGGLDLGGGGLDLGGGGLDLGGGPGGGGGIDLGGGGDGGMGLELPSPQAPAGGDGVVTFGQSSGPASAPAPSDVASRFARKPAHDEDLNLDLDTAPADGPALRKVAPVRNKKTRLAPTDKKKLSKKSKRVLAGVLGLAIVGGGGIYGLQVLQGEQAKGEAVAKLGKGAAAHLASDAPGHWDKAIAEASKMHKADAKNVEPLAILTEAHYAAALDNGTGAANHVKEGGAAINKMRKLKGQGAHVSLAEGLHALTALQLDDAIRHLTAGVNADKKNPTARLYLGWAYAAKHDHHNAIGSFDAALTIKPNRIAALYGKATSLIAIGKHKEANESFLAAIKTYRELHKSDHIGSLLGIAQIVDVDNFGDREKRYLEILNREDIATQDPRMVAKAWALAGDEARSAGRLAVASEAYATAQKLNATSMEAAVGLAGVSYAKGNIDDAAEKLNGVLALAPGNIDAALLYIEVAIAQEDLDRAGGKLADLIDLKPPIEYKPTLSRMQLLRGRILASDDANASDAESAYKQAIDLSPDGGVDASLELAALYNRLERAEEAGAILAPLQAKAKKDPALAVVLGVAYLSTGDPAQAIALFRLALSQHPADAEARFQLGRALANGERADEAITELTRAYEDSEQREDIGLELAEIYSRLERFDEASALFEKILSAEAPSRNARAYAGAYFARQGDIEKASSIGQGLLAESEKDPAGLYLTGEGLFADEKYEDAKDLFSEAVTIEPLPQYLEALGRSYEKLQDFTKGAREYERAIKLDPKYIKPRLGLANIHFARKEYQTVLKDLAPALEIDPRIVQIHYQIGRSHLEMRDTDAALAALQKAVEVDPNHGLSHMAIGLAHNAKGDAKNAVGAFARATRTTGNGDADWLPEAYRLLGYAIRESNGDKGAMRDAWENYIDRVEIEDDQSKEVKKLLIPLQRR